VFNPTWSPDGTQIAYTCWSDQIRIINGDGTGDHAIPNVPSGWVENVDWGIIVTDPSVAITVNQLSVMVDEGQTANNGGTVTASAVDQVSLTASAGTPINNGDGTWSWSYTPDDGPDESQTVIIVAEDGNGQTSETTFELTVNNVAPTIDHVTAPTDPVNINDQPVSVEVLFSDPGAGDVHDVTWDWGDQISNIQTSTTSPATQDHTYSEAGVYPVTVTVTDDDGDADTETYEFIVIYDPDGGFVTGGGWIWSEAGWCQLDDLCAGAEGRARFGFVSRYKKGATVPTGNTEFVFKAGSLSFQSDNYDWLVVTGGDSAKFKGSGTINGLGDYKFMLWADDGETDTFRIRIWEEDELGNETDVYDNGFDQEIGGGSIVVHAKK
jgi:PKD repeat protein